VPVLRERLNEALKTASETDDRLAMGIVRLIHAALRERDQGAAGEGHEGLSDDGLIEMLQAMVDQRAESIRHYEEGGQLELAAREAEEVEIIKRFLPPQLDESDTEAAVREMIAETGARKLKDAGRVMTELRSRYPGQMDFARARRLICRRLG
jgi:uncharacterized protein YqeY